MKKIFKALVASFIITTISISQISFVSANSKTYGDGVKRRIEFSDKNLFLERVVLQNAGAFYGDTPQTQELYFEYNKDKKAYKIYYADDPSFILAYDAYEYHEPNNVFFTKDGNLDEHFWKLEKVPGTNKYYLRNYKTGGYLTAVTRLGGYNVELRYRSDNFNDNYTELTISPGFDFDNDVTVGNGTFKIKSYMYPNQVLNIDTSNNNVNIDYDYRTEGQKWIFEYHPDKDAYKIKNIDSKNNIKILSWNSKINDQVFGYSDVNASDQFWKLEKMGDGTYIIKNYLNHNKVLDLKHLINSIDVRVMDRNNGTGQRFLIEKY